MPNRKGRADSMPEIRGGLMRALKLMAEKGKPLSTVWMELFDEDPGRAIQLAIAAHPKEMRQDINVTTDVINAEDISEEDLNILRHLRAIKQEREDATTH